MNFKVNSKRLFNKSIVKRGYSTSSSSNSTILSERLETIINELGLNLVYCYENLNLEETIPAGMSPIGGLPKGSALSGLFGPPLSQREGGLENKY